MVDGHADGHADGDSHETPDEKVTRNWNELLQELRVTQTGSQILAGFLLTVPFSSRYADLTDGQVRVYLAVLCGSVLSTGFVVAPVAFHRMLFRRGQRRWIVESANKAARAGLGMLALTSSGVLYLVFDVTVGTVPALVAFGVALVFFTLLWLVLPVVRREEA
ncbi:DUF6328 family protein [Nocardioides sp.]|uniref:DUF6328 family protein n=1 Tax=Nocardioides sp. TaxID=35761 RepID=UPI0027285BD6|nr:DUF6328 family protein [Nocardioides sp.]MDO9458125.1 DUF6328 family protein [Nocardioides sp.]